jgi:hypothetical protein
MKGYRKKNDKKEKIYKLREGENGEKELSKDGESGMTRKEGI